MLEKNIDINALDSNSRNALHWAINSKRRNESNFHLEELLIRKGINSRHKDYLGRSPEFYFFVNLTPEGGSKDDDPIENLQSFRALSPIDFSIQDNYGNSLMHYAAIKNSFLCINIILKQKLFNLNLQNHAGNTILSLSMKHKFFNTCIVLLSHEGIDITKDIAIVNEHAMREYE